MPVVAARIGGLPEIVRDGQTGLLFSPGNARELSEQLDRLAQDPPWAHSLGGGGRRVIETEFTLSQQVQTMLELLQEVRSSVSR